MVVQRGGAFHTGGRSISGETIRLKLRSANPPSGSAARTVKAVLTVPETTGAVPEMRPEGRRSKPCGREPESNEKTIWSPPSSSASSSRSTDWPPPSADRFPGGVTQVGAVLKRRTVRVCAMVA